MRTQGALAVDTFTVLRADGEAVSPRAAPALRRSLEDLLRTHPVAATLDDDDPELCAGDVASRAAHALAAEQARLPPTRTLRPAPHTHRTAVGNRA